jgi:triphosphoribosyl-dephospho-CoA synthase
VSAARSRDEIAAAFLAACHAELNALKPGNVHIYAPGHRMQVADFERAAAAAAPFIADPSLGIGRRILTATQASFAATGVNTNLGIILLCAPLAKAAAETAIGMGLRRCLALLLSKLDYDDADDAFKAIRLANPAGLGKVEKGDVSTDAGVAGARFTLIEAMDLAKDRDRIANAYVTAYSDVFDFALPVLDAARATGERADLCVTTLHLALLAEFPDSHIQRKWGPDAALSVQDEARRLKPLWSPIVASNAFEDLLKFDASLKERGFNPGTTADFVVTTLFTDLLSRWAASGSPSDHPT